MVDTVRTLAALQTLLADNVAGDIGAQDVRDMLVSTFPKATNFTPTIVDAGTGWIAGNAQQFGNYYEFGDLVFLLARIIMGSTTTFGSGNWTFALPVDADNSSNEPHFAGSGLMFDANTSDLYPLGLQGAGDQTELNMYYHNGTGKYLSVAFSGPFTWAVNDQIELSLVYQKRAVT